MFIMGTHQILINKLNNSKEIKLITVYVLPS